MQYTYVLYTLKSGVFYVGIGNERRLKTTIQEARTSYTFGPSQKMAYIRYLVAQGEEIFCEPVLESESKAETQACEKLLIAAYGEALTNYVGKDTLYPTYRKNKEGLKKQKFPLQSCQECLTAWKNVTEAYHNWNEHPDDKSKQALYREVKALYDEHIATHPAYIP